MDVVLRIVKGYLIPGSPFFLVAGVGIALLLLTTERGVAWARRWLFLLAAAYVVLGVPVVTGFIHRTIGGHAPVGDAGDARGAGVIVVLGNGAVTVDASGPAIDLPSLETALNIGETVRLHRLLGGRPVIASGGIPPGGSNKRPEAELMRDYLVRMGIPAGDIRLDSASRNTTEQATNIAAMVGPKARVLLVTVPVHMRRAEALFRTRGVDVIPAVSGSLPVESTDWASSVLPNRFALRASEKAAYEVLGLAYYWMTGDIGRPR